jgi:hypothetical protein
MAHFNNAKNQFLDGNRSPLSGGKLHFYDVGTLNAKTTYSDYAETLANANPVVLDSEGRHSDIFYTGQARVILKDSADVTIWDTDNVEDKLGTTTDTSTFITTTGSASTDLALAKYSGTTGTVLVSTGILVDADDNVYGASQLSRTETDDFTTVAGDKGITIYLNAATAKTATIAANASVAYTINTRIEFINIGAGTWTIAINSDTLNSAGSAFDLAQHEAAVATKYLTTTWNLNGGLS